MKLTGKAEEAFKKWFLIESDNTLNLIERSCIDPTESITGWFSNLLESMKFGVYVDFFDSVGIKVTIEIGYSGYLFNYRISMENFNDEFDNEFETRHEARRVAIKKANKILNEKL